ncbi:MAG: 50S ribosomal protein L35 [Patescibacteria group bacterium]
MKTNKSFKKRLKLTRTGKILKRKAGQDHFKAKEKREKQLGQKGWKNFIVKKKKLSRYLPYN